MGESATSEAVSSVRTQERNLSIAEREEGSVCCCGQKPDCVIRKGTWSQHRKQHLMQGHGNVLNYLCTSSDLIYKVYAEESKGPENSKNYQVVEVLPHVDTSLKCWLQFWKDES